MWERGQGGAEVRGGDKERERRVAEGKRQRGDVSAPPSSRTHFRDRKHTVEFCTMYPAYITPIYRAIHRRYIA